MIGYKGFDKDFRCRGMQYEVGKTYHHDGELKLCVSGLHFCQNPLEVFGHYPPNDSRYALIEATGKVVEGENKSCTDELKIVRELTLAELIAAVPGKHKSVATGYGSVATTTGDCSVATTTGDRSASMNTGNRSASTATGYGSVATTTGDCSVATTTCYCSASTATGYGSASMNTGNCSASTATGDCSVATTTGYCSASTATGDCSVATTMGCYSTSEVTGKNSLAVATGFNSTAKGALGCWLVLADWRDNEIADMQIFKVDGKKILPDTFYQLKDGQLTEVQS